MKYYVVADIHSFYFELETALKEKGFFEDTEPHKLIICGDLFESRVILDNARELKRILRENLFTKSNRE